MAERGNKTIPLAVFHKFRLRLPCQHNVSASCHVFTHRQIPCDSVEMYKNVYRLTSCAGMNGTNEYPRRQEVNLNE